MDERERRDDAEHTSQAVVDGDVPAAPAGPEDPPADPDEALNPA